MPPTPCTPPQVRASVHGPPGRPVRKLLHLRHSTHSDRQLRPLAAMLRSHATQNAWHGRWASVIVVHPHMSHSVLLCCRLFLAFSCLWAAVWYCPLCFRMVCPACTVGIYAFAACGPWCSSSYSGPALYQLVIVATCGNLQHVCKWISAGGLGACRSRLRAGCRGCACAGSFSS